MLPEAVANVQIGDSRTLDINIPAGTEDGQSLRLKGKACRALAAHRQVMPCRGKVEPHPFFTRKGQDLHLELPVSLGEAVLGRPFRCRHSMARFP